MYFGISAPFSSLSLFTPSITSGLGYTSLKAQLMTVPPWAVAWVVTLSASYSADHFERYLPFIQLGHANFYQPGPPLRSLRPNWRNGLPRLCRPSSRRIPRTSFLTPQIKPQSNPNLTNNPLRTATAASLLQQAAPSPASHPSSAGSRPTSAQQQEQDSRSHSTSPSVRRARSSACGSINPTRKTGGIRRGTGRMQRSCCSLL